MSYKRQLDLISNYISCCLSTVLCHKPSTFHLAELSPCYPATRMTIYILADSFCNLLHSNVNSPQRPSTDMIKSFPARLLHFYAKFCSFIELVSDLNICLSVPNSHRVISMRAGIFSLHHSVTQEVEQLLAHHKHAL